MSKSPGSIRRIGILTGGGDCPGLNAVIRAVAKTAQNDYALEVIGILDSYSGLLTGQFLPLGNREVSGILHQGGTILGTSRDNPFEEAYRQGRIDSPAENWDLVADVLREQRIDALVAVGGDGTLRVAHRMFQAGLPVVGVPKTIDNDLRGTDVTFGFNSAVSIIMNALDNLHTTAMSHHRAMVVEVMGRTVGWLALTAGLAGGGDVILIPEIPYSMQSVCERVVQRNQSGKRFSIIVVAEGARRRGGDAVFSGTVESTGRKVLGGVGKVLADEIEAATGIETRVTQLGHLQRGGPPTAFDRVLGTRFGHAAVALIEERAFGGMVALRGNRIVSVPLEQATRGIKSVPVGEPLIAAARSVGTAFGD